VDLAQVADELYGLMPAEFRAVRDERARQARADGDRELAAAIAKLRRPTVSAWLVNQLAREAGDDLDRLLDLGQELREAQRTFAGDRLRELAAPRRAQVSALVNQAKRIAAGARQAVSAEVEREVSATLEAALADPQAAAAIRAGRLAGALSYVGLGGEGPGQDMAGLGVAGLAGPPPAATVPAAGEGKPRRHLQAVPGTGATGKRKATAQGSARTRDGFEAGDAATGRGGARDAAAGPRSTRDAAAGRGGEQAAAAQRGQRETTGQRGTTLRAPAARQAGPGDRSGATTTRQAAPRAGSEVAAARRAAREAEAAAQQAAREAAAAQRRAREAAAAEQDVRDAEELATEASATLAEAEDRVASARGRRQAARDELEQLEGRLAEVQQEEAVAARDLREAQRSREAAARAAEAAQRRIVRAKAALKKFRT
jgi:DNA repair exonuclease SbcCD ATPase subunit